MYQVGLMDLTSDKPPRTCASYPTMDQAARHAATLSSLLPDEFAVAVSYFAAVVTSTTPTNEQIHEWIDG